MIYLKNESGNLIEICSPGVIQNTDVIVSRYRSSNQAIGGVWIAVTETISNVSSLLMKIDTSQNQPEDSESGDVWVRLEGG